MYNCLEFNGTDVRRKDCATMSKTEELLQRIENLTQEQFELLIDLYFQQDQEFVPNVQVERQTLLQPSA